MRLTNDSGEGMNCLSMAGKDANVLSKGRLEMLKLLSKREMYPAEIARELGIEVQAVYYHIKLLEKAGMIKFVDYEEKRGAIAKKFAVTSGSFAIVINDGAWKKLPVQEKKLPKLFSPFVANGHFNAKFVLGSPDPHGKYRARGSEFAVLELAMLLGNYASFSYPLYLLDTQLREEDKKQDLILAGGPKVNVLVSEINKYLKVGFESESFDVRSKITGRRYNGNIGIIELLANPFAKNRKMLVFSGLNHHGTRAAVLGILTKMDEIESGNKQDSQAIAKVVEGFDENGDGIVDNIEILE